MHAECEYSQGRILTAEKHPTSTCSRNKVRNPNSAIFIVFYKSLKMLEGKLLSGNT